MKSLIKGPYAITDPGLIPDESLVDIVFQAISGGVGIIQYRDKRLQGNRERALALRELTRSTDTLLIVNDDPELALEVDADGVHLGVDDPDLIESRKRLGDRIIGVSCYNRLELALEAQQSGADYVAFGSFFPTTSKPRTVRAKLELLKQAREQIDIPIVAIGGITPQNGAPLIVAGADALAVISAVFAADDVRKSAAELKQLFDINSGYK